MQIFGLVSLLVVAALIAFMFSGKDAAEQLEERQMYESAIESAKDSVSSIETNISLSSKSVFVYDGISVPDDTKSLDLSGRGLSGSLKAEIRHLSELRQLDLSVNQFTGLPAEVGQLTKLEVLNLANNPLTGLPHELGNLANLQTLDLRGTSYSEYDLGIIEQKLPAGVSILTD